MGSCKPPPCHRPSSNRWGEGACSPALCSELPLSDSVVLHYCTVRQIPRQLFNCLVAGLQFHVSLSYHNILQPFLRTPSSKESFHLKGYNLVSPNLSSLGHENMWPMTLELVYFHFTSTLLKSGWVLLTTKECYDPL